jgi:hypothetical protein
MIIRNHRQAVPETLGEARRRFYDIYTLVRHALPADTSHQSTCELLSELASSSYAKAEEDRASMESLWAGHEPDPRRRAPHSR